jgi:hypothetical protein
MYALMLLQMILITEWLITHVTAKWRFPAMYTLMLRQIILIEE